MDGLDLYFQMSCYAESVPTMDGPADSLLLVPDDVFTY